MQTNITRTLASILTNRFVIIVTFLTVLVISAATSVNAYGPQRSTFTIQNAATYITFNSITNNASYGDERDFMNIKDASITTSGGWSNDLQVQNGKEYWVRVLVHNNAKSELNLTATNTRVSVSVPNNTATSIPLDGYVSANNSNPREVWDNAVMRSDKKFNITYVTGSSRYYNNVRPTDGFALSDSIVTSSGALVGYQSMNGQIPGCNQYSGYAIFKVKVNMEQSPNFIAEKSVRLHGTETWKKSITAKPGQKVDYQIYYDNTGDSNQLNVVAVDKLPKGVKYQAGSTTLRNAANNNGNGLSVKNDSLVKASGINIGSYAPNSNAYVRFTATLPPKSKLECGKNTLVNTGTISTPNGEKDDTATVVVNKQCAGVEALPQTGPLEVIAGLVGVAAITFGIVYYLKSRRELDQAVMDAHSHSTVKKAPIDPPHHHDHKK